jgi:hypothetical protein
MHNIETLFFHTAFPGRGKKKSRATVAGVLMKDGTIRFGIAKCDKEDNFSRKAGRELALERANGNDTYVYSASPAPRLSDGETIPQWFANTAKVLGNLVLEGKISVVGLLKSIENVG